MRREIDDSGDDAALKDRRADELRPKGLGIDIGDGPDVILNRDVRRLEQAALRGVKARAKSAVGVCVEQQGDFDKSQRVGSLECTARLENMAPKHMGIDEITCALGKNPRN